MTQSSSPLAPLYGLWLWLVRMADSVAGLALIVEGALLLVRLARYTRKVWLPLRWMDLQMHVSYPKQMILTGIIALVFALLVSLAHDGLRQSGRLGIFGFFAGISATAWGALCALVLWRLFGGYAARGW